MSVPIFVEFEPINQLSYGLVAEDVNDPTVGNGLGVISFGFILGTIWALCVNGVSTTWSDCFGAISTSWSACFSNPVTTWTDCS